ncbi:MAG: hypothetical protein ACE1ZG_01330 [Gammaproteobacteria bacterium]
MLTVAQIMLFCKKKRMVLDDAVPSTAGAIMSITYTVLLIKVD